MLLPAGEQLLVGQLAVVESVAAVEPLAVECVVAAIVARAVVGVAGQLDTTELGIGRIGIRGVGRAVVSGTVGRAVVGVAGQRAAVSGLGEPGVGGLAAE